MNGKIKWNDDLNTGIKEIDEQHKEIINAVNDLYQALEKNKNKYAIVELIKNLDFYTTFHFDTEEKYMKMYNFGNYEEHKRAHGFFRSTYEQIRYNYYYIGDKSSPKYELVHLLALHLSQILIDWLNLHFETFDKEFVAFLRDKRN